MTGKQSAQLRSSLELCEPHSQAGPAGCRSTKEGPVDGDVGLGFGDAASSNLRRIDPLVVCPEHHGTYREFVSPSF